MATGKEIKRLRGKISAARVAELIGVDADRLRKWEERDTDPKDTGDVEKVEAYFGVTLSELADLTNFDFVKKPKGNPGQDRDKDKIIALQDQIIQLKDKEQSELQNS